MVYIGELALAATLLLALGAGAVEEVPYGVASWPETMGSCRAKVRVTERADAVLAHIPWRRRDADPQGKDVMVYDAATGKQVTNAAPMSITRESGDIVFQPDTAPGEYYVYYLPYTVTKPEQWAYAIAYNAPKATADPAWLDRNGLAKPDGKWKSMPKAEVAEIQARSEFSRFDPMEIIATQDEVTQLLGRFPLRTYLVFPEDRKFPSRMTDDLPLRWVSSGPATEFKGEAAKNEFYVFQVGVYAARKAVDGVSAQVSDLVSKAGQVIPGDSFTCFNLGGLDWLGRPLTKTFSVPAGKVRTLWFGVQVPMGAAPGDYQGQVVIKPEGAPLSSIKLTLTVTDNTLPDHGDGDLWRLSRLRWLDSTIGLDDEVVAPYTPVQMSKNTIALLNRSVRYAKSGLPDSIISNGVEILARPIDVIIETAKDKTSWKGKELKTLGSAPGGVVTETSGQAGSCSLTCRTKTEFDGYISILCLLKASQAMELNDVRLEIPIRREVATYMMGMGFRGGYRPKEWKWAWDSNRVDNQIWIGGVDAGLQCKLKGHEDSWQIADKTPNGLPVSWWNGGKGGCTISEEGDQVVVRAHTGARSLKAGEELELRFSLLVTPVKPLDPDHWKQRYYHFYTEVPKPEDIAKTGATIVNIHQGNPINPYINYPFQTVDKLKDYVKQLHDKGMKAKIYYTVRELSNHTAELWPLWSLDDEIIASGAGGGDPWLREHLVSNYRVGWQQPYANMDSDAAFATADLSRWHNYYLESLDWLVRNVGIDGLYLDGIGYDREIMKRVRKVFDAAHPGCLIDFHSGDNYSYNDTRVSPASFYMEHFPYISSLWFGEIYDYNLPPDYWLVEVSGIPFGLYGEMLQGGGNPWRGMLYGMTNRLGWQGDPKEIWKHWDSFGIADAKMIGYWDPACPVTTGSKDVLATVYANKGKALISIASWAKEKAQCKLTLDWKALGIDMRKAHLSAPAIPGFQDAADFALSSDIPVEPGKGWLLVLAEK